MAGSGEGGGGEEIERAIIRVIRLYIVIRAREAGALHVSSECDDSMGPPRAARYRNWIMSILDPLFLVPPLQR